MPFIGSISGSQGFGRGGGAAPPSWISSGSLGTLTDAQRAAGNTFTVSASAGPGATSVSYSLVTGSLPAGASLNGTSGIISGFSAVSSNTTSSFTLRATNNAGLTADAALSITINAVTITWSSPASQTFPSQLVGATFTTQTYVASASSGSIAYTVVSGSVPSGTSVASNGSHTGTISGGATTYNWTIRATVTSGSATATVDQSFAQAVTAPIDLINTTTFQNLRNYMVARQGNYQNSNFYSWALDQPPGQISDGNGDMYDGGHCISLLENGSQVAGNCLDFNTSNSTGGNLRWGAGSYTYPLFALATSGRANRTYGWNSNGNLGADGGGGRTNQQVYNVQTVNSCIVHSWIGNLSYSTGDASVNYLYVTIGHSALGSSINAVNNQDAPGSPDNDNHTYQTTSFNCIIARVLCSSPSGQIVNVGQAQSIVGQMTQHFREALGI